MVYLLNITDIKIPSNRQRRIFTPEAIIELAESIQWGKAGLQNPIVVRKQGEDYFLVSGERRLRAISDIHELNGVFYYADQEVPFGQIPCTLIGELSEIEAMEAELDENIRREDLTWSEKAQATAALNALRTAQATAQGKDLPTYTDIAEEVYGSRDATPQSTVRKEVLVAKHLEAKPELAKAKTLDEAFKILKQEEQKEKHKVLAEEVGRSFNNSKHTLVNADSQEYIKTIPDNTFSVILTDPPYGMGADTFGTSNKDSMGGHTYEDSLDILISIMKWFSTESYRVAAAQAHLYCFVDFGNFPFMVDAFAAAGWKVFRTPFIWSKPGAYRAPWPEQGPQRQYECILYAVKGDKKVNYLGSDVLTFPTDTNLGHQAQKPIALYTELLKRSITPGDKVADFFCGSGVIFPAATAVSCYATGVEMDKQHYGLAASRLKGENE